MHYVNYEVQEENKVPLFDFIAKKEKNFQDHYFDTQRLGSLKRKNYVVFNIEDKENFDYDIIGYSHYREAILNDLASDPENFQNGFILYNFPKILDRLVNKGKHYFVFSNDLLFFY